MKTRYCKSPSIFLAFALCLASCTVYDEFSSDGPADSTVIEVPPPVEQTNSELNIWYTDYGMTEKYLDAAVTQYNQQHPDNPITAEKYFADNSSESNWPRSDFL